MVFSCPVCFDKLSNLQHLLTHIRLVHADDPNFRVQCNYQGCRQTFRKFTVYRNHIYQYHNSVEIEQGEEDDDEHDDNEHGGPGDLVDSDDDSGGDDFDNDESSQADVWEPPSPGKLQMACAKWALKVSEVHKVPQSTVDSIVSGVQHLVCTGMFSMMLFWLMMSYHELCCVCVFFSIEN